MSDTLNEDLLSISGTVGIAPEPVDRSITIQSTSLLEQGEQMQDLTKPYRIAFKGILANGECSGD